MKAPKSAATRRWLAASRCCPGCTRPSTPRAWGPPARRGLPRPDAMQRRGDRQSGDGPRDHPQRPPPARRDCAGLASHRQCGQLVTQTTIASDPDGDTITCFVPRSTDRAFLPPDGHVYIQSAPVREGSNRLSIGVRTKDSVHENQELVRGMVLRPGRTVACCPLGKTRHVENRHGRQA